mmetsp:Transcript_21452/g.50816  ORF Transcript_21452/g.50816 Transcript_21452/m.50816 type:complete len:210 (+) Transcript_21452:627-1256(+)
MRERNNPLDAAVVQKNPRLSKAAANSGLSRSRLPHRNEENRCAVTRTRAMRSVNGRDERQGRMRQKSREGQPQGRPRNPIELQCLTRARLARRTAKPNDDNESLGLVHSINRNRCHRWNRERITPHRLEKESDKHWCNVNRFAQTVSLQMSDDSTRTSSTSGNSHENRVARINRNPPRAKSCSIRQPWTMTRNPRSIRRKERRPRPTRV